MTNFSIIPRSPTRSINAQPITSKREDLPTCRVDRGRRQSLFATHDLDELDSDALKQLKHLCPIQDSNSLEFHTLPYVHNRFYIHSRWCLISYLRSVSAGLSKLFWLFSSEISSSFAASSSGVGRTVEIGGVTPHWRTDGAAILDCVRVALLLAWFTTGTWMDLRELQGNKQK